jgi:DNA polymerase-3 subunit alpha
LSQRPLEAFSVLLAEQTTPINTLKPEHEGRAVVIGGAITETREITTKNGQKMAFVKLEDEHGEIEAILFPSAYQQTIGLWERDRVVIIRGKISSKGRDGTIGQDVKVLVDEAREVTHEQAAAYQITGRKKKVPKPTKLKATAASSGETVNKQVASPRLYIRLMRSDNTELLQQLKAIVDRTIGEREVVLVLGPDSAKQAVKLPNRIQATDDIVNELNSLVGADMVKLQ